MCGGVDVWDSCSTIAEMVIQTNMPMLVYSCLFTVNNPPIGTRTPLASYQQSKSNIAGHSGHSHQGATVKQLALKSAIANWTFLENDITVYIDNRSRLVIVVVRNLWILALIHRSIEDNFFRLVWSRPLLSYQ